MSTPNQPLRVAHVWRQTAAGGSAGTFWRLYQALDKSQVQCDFLVQSPGLFIDPAAVAALGGRVFLVPSLKHPRRYQKYLRALFQKEHYDIVHVHLNELSVFALKAAAQAQIPVRIAHAHSGAHWHEFAKTFIKACLRPQVPRYATHFMAISAAAATHLFATKTTPVTLLALPAAATKNTTARAVTLLPNAVDLTQFAFDAALRRYTRQQLGITPQQLVLGHVGRLTKQKNQQFLLRILKNIRRYHPQTVLLLVGEGPLKRRLQRQARRLGVAANVLFVGAQAAVAPYYQAMDVFVMPSWYEGLPSAGLEAQAAGLACLFADTITPEVLVTARAQQLPLKVGAKVWARQVMLLGNLPRTAVDCSALSQTFNVTTQAAQLTTYYQTLAGATCAR